ncbi:hypothetical protein [Telluribacter sp. SYSU D00476]|uniref:hypothetical protein n=1 Tax=Telluribacter sp. SYSU D00476 TaxID=2811430 RepID=UPI001FF31E95|nr:hypothetical protein [Telluribacter sp. SYSU D00476]
MKLHQLVLVLALSLYYSAASAQQLSLSRLFYPNVTLRAEYFAPANVPTSTDFGLTRTSFFGMVPLQSEVQAGFSLRKKFDLRAVHTVAIAQFSQLQPTFDGVKTPTNGYKTGSLGVIRLQASIKDRLWVYGAGLGITETNETFFTPSPYLWGGAARMHIFGLQSQILYGSMLVYSQKLRVVPVVGVNKRFGPQWRATALLPFMADVNYKINKWANVDFIAGVNGYSGGFQIQTPEEKMLRRQNYQHLKLGVAANAHLFTILNVSVEAGMTGFRQLRTFNSARENLTAYSPAPAPYIGASVRYITSRSGISSKFTKRLGLGDSGINW